MAAGDGGGAYVLDGAHGRPISSVVIIVAVRSQALPLVKRFQLTEDATLLAEGIPCVRYYGIYKDLCINVLWLGQDLAHGKEIQTQALFSNDCYLDNGAAIAYVADLLKIPAIFIKAVSYIVDGKKLDAESHLQNLTGVSSMLDEAVVGAIEFINGKRLSEL
ncbi:hypothetical protein SAY86_004433 [Trapa natans]|uniref:Nucleoside phosphorylase domain-containing protein n=1 Tax=Trapa natans TaxID=22666 RepID=A0AAN7RNU2_TRANT|nr:hypothetical protein SAY86_004433 [Trapa natans]